MRNCCILLLFFFALVARAEMVIEENFNGPSVADRVFRNFRIIEEKETRKIKTSCVSFGDGFMTVDTAGEKDYPQIFSYPKTGTLKPGFRYKVSFDYRILRANVKGEGFFAVFDGAIKGNFTRFGGRFFGMRDGEKGHYQAEAIFPDIPSIRCRFVLTERIAGGSIEISNFKLERFPLSHIEPWLLKEDAFVGIKRNPIYNGYFAFNPEFGKITKEKFFPFVDKFGQFKHKEWKDKVHSLDDMKLRASEERKYLDSIGEIPNRDSWGGLVDEKLNFGKSKNFRVKKVKGKWYFITPEGNLFWSLGVNAVGLYQGTPFDGERIKYFDEIPKDKHRIKVLNWKNPSKELLNVYIFEKKNIELKYGEGALETTYPLLVNERLRKWGFNSLGWPAENMALLVKIPFACVIGSGGGKVPIINYKMGNSHKRIQDFFDPEFEKSTLANFKRKSKLLNSPYSFGVYIDNEPPWPANPSAIARAVLVSSPSLASKAVFGELLRCKYNNSIDALNKAWGAKFADWDALMSNTTFAPKGEQAMEDMREFEKLFYEKYFSTCKKSLAELAPGKLYMGCRFSSNNDLLVRVASYYCDVLSFNLYRESVEKFSLPEGSRDVPVIIGEFHFGNLDRGPFGGALKIYNTIEERVEAFKSYINGALKNPSIVGAHWFRWCDQVTSGRPGDGENFSCGLVDVCDTPIYEMAEASRQLQQNMYNIRAEF